MRKVLIDTDVLLDVALRRSKFFSGGADVLRWAESGGQAAIAWHSISNCAYLLKHEGRDFLKMLLSIVDVAPVAAKEAHRALDLPMKDLEDAIPVLNSEQPLIYTASLGSNTSRPFGPKSFALTHPARFAYCLPHRGQSNSLSDPPPVVRACRIDRGRN